MFLGYQGEKIKFYTAEPLDEILYNITETVETEDEYVFNGDEYVLKDEQWEEEQTAKRQADFEANFLTTSLGNYRLVPKGYANAQQSIDTVNALVVYSQGLTEQIAEKVIFYATPDFTKPEECTEEWLVEHQSHPEPMTLQQWGAFYFEFTTLYANKMYQQQLKGEL